MLEVEETGRRWRDQYITAREVMNLIDHQLKQLFIRLEKLKMINSFWSYDEKSRIRMTKYTSHFKHTIQTFFKKIDF